jgi:hypothetical protein
VQPISLVHDTGGPRPEPRWSGSRGSRAVRALVSPWQTELLYVAVLVLTHLYWLPAEMSQHMWIHDAEPPL